MDKVKAVKTLRKLVNERSLEKVGGYIKNLLVEFLKEHQNYLSSGFYHLWLAVSAKDLEKLLLSNIVVKQWGMKEKDGVVILSWYLEIYPKNPLSSTKTFEIRDVEIFVRRHLIYTSSLDYIEHLKRAAMRGKVVEVIEALETLFRLIVDEVESRTSEKFVMLRFDRFKKTKIYTDGMVYLKL